MRNRDVLILRSEEIDEVLTGREREIMRSVEAAYLLHAAGDSSLPNSLFLRFPRDERNRIIALPAYLGQDFNAAGVKWVSSFPGNHEKGLNRASAIIIINSADTGRPEVVMEGSLVSAKRTAASAALAAAYLQNGRETDCLGIVGCGPINFEVVRFVLHVMPTVKRLLLFDLDRLHAEHFQKKCCTLGADTEIMIVRESEALFSEARLTSIATTATQPHIFDLSSCVPGATILDISLRDFASAAILAADNVVDNVDHVCRAQTSVHLAEQLTGNRDFIRCELADLLKGTATPKPEPDQITIFSPFGLGVLDLAVGCLAWQLALEKGYGTMIEEFLPASYWEEPVMSCGSEVRSTSFPRISEMPSLS